MEEKDHDGKTLTVGLLSGDVDDEDVLDVGVRGDEEHDVDDGDSRVSGHFRSGNESILRRVACFYYFGI